MYVIEKDQKDVAAVRANTPAQAMNIFARRTKTGVVARCIDADEFYTAVVQNNLPVYEPETAAESEQEQEQQTAETDGAAK